MARTIEQRAKATRPIVVPATNIINRVEDRLLVGSGFLLALLIFLFGTSWDIQWHADIGRDQLFTPPHLMMIGSIALAGLLALIDILFESWRYRTIRDVDSADIFKFWPVFHAARGSYIAGFGALISVIAFPLDDYWHQIYGIDVTLWAPFHLMILGGLLLISLGMVDLCAATAGRPTITRTARLIFQVGMVAGLATALGLASFLLDEMVFDDGLINTTIGGQNITLDRYPIYLSIAPLGLVAAALAIPWPGGATIVALIITALKLTMGPVTTYAVDYLATNYNYNYRGDATMIPMAANALPTFVIIAALILDLFVWFSRRKGRNTKLIPIIGGILFVLISVVLDQPWVKDSNYWRFNSAQNVLLYSLPLVIAGALLSSWLGARLGSGLAAIEQRDDYAV